VSTSGKGEESAEAGADNDTDSERGIVLKAVTKYCGEKYGTDSKKRDICRHNFLVEGL